MAAAIPCITDEPVLGLHQAPRIHSNLSTVQLSDFSLYIETSPLLMNQRSTFVLRVEGLNFAYQKDDSVLKGVSFAVERGQIVCLLGPSGCGKSTLLRIIAGLLKPVSGQIWIDEKDQADVPTYRRNLGFVFQDAALFPHLSVEENLAFPFKRGRRKLKEPWTD